MYWLLILALIGGINAESNSSTFTCVDNVGTEDTFCGKLPAKCVPSKYRSHDGSCNNLQKRWWGTANSPYQKLCSPCLECYTTLNNTRLPNPRKISLDVFIPLDVSDPLWTVLFMQYGQIVAHDMSLTQGVAQTKKDQVICCANGKLTAAARTDPKCFPIPIPKDDPYNALQNITCMDFYRVETTSDRICTNPPDIPAPLNAVTAYLDLSLIYGNDEIIAKGVRAFRRGKLKSTYRKGKEVLPQDPNSMETCNVDSPKEPCYFSGDVRVNQNPQLSLLHIIYMEHHNEIAKDLGKVNPFWDDDTLFQETRRINIAIHQCIIYNEYLTGLLGTEYMVENKLLYPNETGFVDDYDPNTNVAVTNEFATIAFRLFHTEIVGLLRSLSESRNLNEVVQLSDWYDRPGICEYRNNFDGLTRGMAEQPASAVDRFISQDVLNLLFKQGLTGQDLKAIDIQRSRDQGVCSFPQALRKFGLADLKTFDDLNEFLDPKIVKVLEKLYKNFECTELLAVFLERRLPQSLTGPLARAILGEQFKRLRTGDRYFYQSPRSGFTQAQLDSINEVCHISNILCMNKDIKHMQLDAFKIVSDSNPMQSCKKYPNMDLSPWKEKLSLFEI